MKTFELKLTTVLLGTLLVPGPSASALAQQRATAPTAQAAAPSRTSAKPVVEEEDEKPSPSKPGTEGIKVHGHWILDLKDKDGKVIEHRDFHNSLLYSGADLLTKLIAGQGVMSALQINAGGFIMYRPDIANHGLNSCNSNPPTSVACVPNLTIKYAQYNLTNSTPSTITLNGSFTPTAATTVSTVYTTSVACYFSTQPTTAVNVTESPSRCSALDLDAGVTSQDEFFTGTSITPINVAAGQTLAITVIISFS